MKQTFLNRMRIVVAFAVAGMLANPVMAANDDRQNVLGGPLALCCSDPATGYKRDGYCRAIDDDAGTHTVCSIVTERFLAFTKAHGNDLSTPRPEYNFPGLKEGDRWCLCASRWKEALEGGVAPPVDLAATDSRTLQFVSLSDLKAHSK